MAVLVIKEIDCDINVNEPSFLHSELSEVDWLEHSDSGWGQVSWCSISSGLSDFLLNSSTFPLACWFGVFSGYTEDCNLWPYLGIALAWFFVLVRHLCLYFQMICSGTGFSRNSQTNFHSRYWGSCSHVCKRSNPVTCPPGVKCPLQKKLKFWGR